MKNDIPKKQIELRLKSILADNVPEEVKNSRLEELMELQQEISLELNEQKIDKIFKVLIDRVEGEFYVGRTEFDSPEVDNEVLISLKANCSIGEFYEIKVISASPFDLYGDIAK